MKLYRDYAQASVSMRDSDELRRLLADVIAQRGISHVIETGTYDGLGSTQFVAESFRPEAPPRSFVTIEASWQTWRIAKRNLRRYPFVTPLWGLSLTLASAIAFVEQDEFIRDHERYPDVFIDDVDDPVEFYARELRGDLSGALGLRHRVLRAVDRRLRYSGEGLLAKSLLAVRDSNPLVLLDSAGGIGWLEFSELQRVMARHTYVVLLDDVHHVKHYRSFQHVRGDPAFRILGTDPVHGWALAEHSPAAA